MNRPSERESPRVVDSLRESNRLAPRAGHNQNAPPPPNDLTRLQRWLHSVITHPQGIAAGITSPPAQSEFNLTLEHANQIIRPSHALTSLDRLAIYGNAYYPRLLECLRHEFPALTHALGEDTFNAFAFGYLQQYPSQSYTLADLSARFPQYLAETRPTNDIPTEDNAAPPPADWPDFLIDLARLERTYSEVFDAPGPETLTLLQPDDLARIPPDAWPGARLELIPSLRLLPLSFPVHEYASAVRRNESPEIPPPQPTWLVITRRDYIVRRAAVSQAAFELLRQFQQGHPLSEAIEHAAAHHEASLEGFAQDLQTWFHQWAEAGYFRTVQIRNADEPRRHGDTEKNRI